MSECGTARLRHSYSERTKVMAKVGILTDGDRRILAEVDDEIVLRANVARAAGLPEGFEAVGHTEELVEGLRDLKQLVINAATTLNEAVKGIPIKPAKVTVEFGVKFAGEGGVPMLTKASAEAAIKIALEWS